MSGLLVKSTVIMRENLEEMGRQGLKIPVMLGGAALTRAYVEEDCWKAYAEGPVAYARDAFDGLSLMDKVVTGSFADYVGERTAKAAQRTKPGKKPRTLEFANGAGTMAARPVELEEIRVHRRELADGVAVPTPPFLGPRLIEHVPVQGAPALPQ